MPQRRATDGPTTFASLDAQELPVVREYSAGGLVFDDKGRVAIIARHSRSGHLEWCLPKGHIEKGETPQQTAVREVHEETGILGEVVDSIATIDYWFTGTSQRVHKLVHHFALRQIGGELTVEGDPDHEAEDAIWVDFADLDDVLSYPNERKDSMVVRKETQQTGVKVNQPAQRNVPHGMRALSAILAMVMTMALMLLYAPVPKAEAEETQESQSGTMLSIDSSTAVLTDTSGYHLSATVTNTTDQEIPSGTLTLAMNAFYTFVSRNDIQEWSEGIGQIPTPNIVGQSEVPALQPGASANVHIDADSNQETLASVNSWGPKPVTLSYEPMAFNKTKRTLSQHGPELESIPPTRPR